MTIAVYARSTKDNHSAYVEQIQQLLKEEGVDLIIYEPFYEFLKTKHQFKLELERDCASSGATFETTVRVGLYANTTNKLVKTLTMVRTSVVKSPYTYNCDGINRCVEVGTFMYTM